jgi:hypothetical protein
MLPLFSLWKKVASQYRSTPDQGRPQPACAAHCDHCFDGDRIISILPVAAQSLVTVKGPQFKVLYRAQ